MLSAVITGESEVPVYIKLTTLWPNWYGTSLGMIQLYDFMTGTTNNKNFMFVDPCIIVRFIKKNPTRCNNVSKSYYSLFI